MKRVGIYAGTFDPIHQGHVQFAQEAADQCRLDKVFFMVEPSPRYKQAVKALEHRQAMTQIATEQQARFGTVLIDQQQFTVTETMPLLSARFADAELYLLLGDDVLRHLVDWANVAALVRAVTFIIGRRNTSIEHIRELIMNIEKTRGVHLKYRVVETTKSDVSSSAIRLSYKYGTEPQGLSEAVRAYIVNAGLYASAESM